MGSFNTDFNAVLRRSAVRYAAGGAYRYSTELVRAKDTHRQNLIAHLESTGDPDDKVEAAIQRVIVDPHSAEHVASLVEQMGGSEVARHYAQHFGSGAAAYTDLIHKAVVSGMPAGKHAGVTFNRRQPTDMAHLFSQKAEEQAGRRYEYNERNLTDKDREAYDKLMAEVDGESARYNELAADRHLEAADEHRRMGEEEQAQVHETAAEAHLKAFAVRLALAGGRPAVQPQALPQPQMPQLPTVKGIRSVINKSLPPKKSEGE